MSNISITTLNADLDTAWNDEAGETEAVVVLKFGHAEVARWPVPRDRIYALTNGYDWEHELELFVAERLASLLQVDAA